MFNPFKENRTEQMYELWRYYVPFPGVDSSGKPLVIEGGRGSGKTMFFQCNSWRQMLKENEKLSGDISSYVMGECTIGLYYRVDTTFVSSMKGEVDIAWGDIFDTYFSICILKEILDMLKALEKKMTLAKDKTAEFVEKFSKRFFQDSKVTTIAEFYNETDFYLDYIENTINGIENRVDIRHVKASRFINDICDSCRKLIGNEEVLFKVFIDEYETLEEEQQRQINTLIKHSTLPVIFNIGLRPGGMKTIKTISPTEIIEAPHDFELVMLGVEPGNYIGLLREICKKRIALAKEQGKIPVHASENIDYYLGNYKFEDELENICAGKREAPFKSELKEIIKTRGKEEGLSKCEINEYVEVLCSNAPVLNARLHYALLRKKTPYTPMIKELFSVYQNKEKRYNDWLHNRKHGLLYLLCKEYKKEKMYYGFDVYAALSSGIVRYFLELCEQAFKIAYLDGYDWKEPISPEAQSEAAKNVSEYKMADIVGYQPYGRELRIFIQYLGKIFYKLHTDKDMTLGEPEPNHFSTKDLSLSKKVEKIIISAIMWNVLQESGATKRKQSVLSPETADYSINKIYTPYFGISYRKQRKLIIRPDLLEELFSGEENRAKNAFMKYFKEMPVKEDGQITLFEVVEGMYD